MTSDEISRLMDQYSRGDVSEDYFRNAIASYRQAEFTPEQSALAKYYERTSSLYEERAKDYTQQRQKAEEQLRGFLVEEVERYKAQSKEMRRLRNLGRGADYVKMYELGQASRNILSIVGRSFAPEELLKPDFAQTVTFGNLNYSIKRATSRRGNILTPWGKTQIAFMGARLSEEDYLSQSSVAREKFQTQTQKDAEEQRKRFEENKASILEYAERMFTPRKAYTERSL